jgi:hypothetical protein
MLRQRRSEEKADSATEDEIEEQEVIQAQNELCQEAQASNAPGLSRIWVFP